MGVFPEGFGQGFGPGADGGSGRSRGGRAQEGGEGGEKDGGKGRKGATERVTWVTSGREPVAGADRGGRGVTGVVARGRQVG
ncbi:hypothetical protein GCM10017667_64650 [Streptomyces filamentosus]|uniref:Uncharacterized protein n=1 Tax=Streptomyces filamentosus TaxID=67294 RepID=A0A919ERS3_STRFL|nr:hypothetical protein GCM10017667_64650 [Streptomyces filamentosus]